MAQCDAHVTSFLVQRDNLPVQSMVDKISDSEYSEKLTNNALYKKFDSLLRQSYLEAKENKFEFRPDSFGGYGLHYVGETVLKAFQSNTFISNLWAALEKIDTEDEDKIKPISVFKPTDFCNLSRIMVVSVRFLNHPCFPNCEYEVKDWKNRICVKLKIIRDIDPETE